MFTLFRHTLFRGLLHLYRIKIPVSFTFYFCIIFQWNKNRRLVWKNSSWFFRHCFFETSFWGLLIHCVSLLLIWEFHDISKTSRNALECLGLHRFHRVFEYFLSVSWCSIKFLYSYLNLLSLVCYELYQNIIDLIVLIPLFH